MADIPVTGGSTPLYYTQGPSQAWSRGEECRADGEIDLSTQALTPEYVSDLNSFLNLTLGNVDRLRNGNNLPNLHQMASSRQEEKKQHETASHAEGHGTVATEGHGGGHGSEHGGASTTYVKVTHGTEFTHTAIEHTAEAIHKWKAGTPHTAPVQPPVTPAPSSPLPNTAPASTLTPPAPTPQAPVTTTTTPQIPLREPISEDMRLYVEAVRNSQQGGTTGTTAATQGTGATGTAGATASKPFQVPLKEPISEDMRLYAEAVREANKPPAPVPKATVTPAESLPAEPVPAPKAPTGGTGTPSSGTTQAASEAAEHGSGHGGGKLHGALRTANKVLGPAAMVAGGLEAAHGISQIKNGQTVEGSLNVAGGVAGMTSGAATTAAAFSSATTLSGVGIGSSAAGIGTVTLGAVAAGAGGVVAVADGVKNIYQGVKEGNTEKTVVGGVKTAAGAAMIAGACTGNPILVAGGAVTYVGAVVYENREAIADGAKKAYNWSADKVDKGVKATKEFAGNVAAKTGELKDATLKKASEIKDSVSSTLSSAGDSISGGAKKAWGWATSWM